MTAATRLLENDRPVSLSRTALSTRVPLGLGITGFDGNDALFQDDVVRLLIVSANDLLSSSCARAAVLSNTALRSSGSSSYLSLRIMVRDDDRRVVRSHVLHPRVPLERNRGERRGRDDIHHAGLKRRVDLGDAELDGACANAL